MSKALIPCPYCGCPACVRIPYKRNIAIQCRHCGATSDFYKTEDEAIEAWNRRPSPWHTGTPTEEGWYLIAFHPWGRKENGICYMCLEWKEGHWFDHVNDYETEPYLVAWQKIKLYTPEQVTGK